MKRSKFDLSHWRLHSASMGYLECIDCIEVLPGDTLRNSTQALIRLSPLVTPAMHPLMVDMWWFFVPNRLVWENWATFITDPDSGLTVPQNPIVASSTETSAYYLARQLGLGDGRGTADAFPTSMSVNALPLRAYQLIYNEFFRDQNLTAPAVVDTDNGPDTAADYFTRRALWRKDYFTTARTAPQDGALSEMAIAVAVTEGGVTRTLERGGSGAGANVIINEAGGASGTDLSFNGYLSVEAWRRAVARQKFREHRNRFGSRYTDYLRYLGVTPSDARLQRPEFLGRASQVVSVSEVLSTAETTGAVVGDMAGHGIAAMRSRPWQRFFEEHGHVIGLFTCRPVPVYQNAVPRNWYRSAWSDYWQKEMEIEGDQAVLKKELNAAEANASQNTVFGYQRRYDEYRRQFSSVVGEFATTLNDWHFAREWADNTGPVLNETFLNCEPTEVPFASQDEDTLRMMIHHQVVARRLVSKHARV